MEGGCCPDWPARGRSNRLTPRPARDPASLTVPALPSTVSLWAGMLSGAGPTQSGRGPPPRRIIGRQRRSLLAQGRDAQEGDKEGQNLYPLPHAAEVMVGMRRVAVALHDELLEGVSHEEFTTTLNVLERVKDTLTALDQAGREPVAKKRVTRAKKASA